MGQVLNTFIKYSLWYLMEKPAYVFGTSTTIVFLPFVVVPFY